ncbi:hypothetical protein STEG23_008454 [Scotinomys teguina]
MDANTALQEVLKTALIHDGLARGIREAAKALDNRQVHLYVLASSCDKPMDVKLVEALCAEHQISLIKVDDNKKLGEWLGLCETDQEGNLQKLVVAVVWWLRTMAKNLRPRILIKEYTLLPGYQPTYIHKHTQTDVYTGQLTVKWEIQRETGRRRGDGSKPPKEQYVMGLR